MKAYTDLEQSKKLAEILPLESADMYYFGIDDYPNSPYQYHELMFGGIDKEDMEDFGHIPCWSLTALLGVLPEGIVEPYYAPNLQKENGKYSIAYGDEELLCIADNPVDACYEMILKLHELKVL